MVLEKTLESPLDCKEMQPVHSKGDQSWVFFGRTNAKAEAPVLWPPHAKSWLIGKESDAGRDWGQEEKGTTEDEMAGWHHWLNGHESEWTPGDGDGQGGLACCDSWGRKESDTTERLNWTELNHYRKTQTCNSLRNIDSFSSLNRSEEIVSSGWLCPTWSFRTPDSPHWGAQLSPDSWNHLHGWDELPQSQGLRQWKGQENLHEACLARLDQKWKLHGIFPLYVPVMKT